MVCMYLGIDDMYYVDINSWYVHIDDMYAGVNGIDVCRYIWYVCMQV